MIVISKEPAFTSHEFMSRTRNIYNISPRSGHANQLRDALLHANMTEVIGTITNIRRTLPGWLEVNKILMQVVDSIKEEPAVSMTLIWRAFDQAPIVRLCEKESRRFKTFNFDD